MLTIESAGFYVPDKKLDPLHDYELLGISAREGQICSRIFGLRQIPIADNENLVDLVLKAVHNMQQNCFFDLARVDYLIHAYTGGDIAAIGKSIVRNIANKLSIDRSKAFATNINKCVSVFAALEMAEAMIQAGQASHILIVTGDVGYTKDMRIISNISITGDGAACILVSKNGTKDKMIKSSQQVYGRYSRGIWSTSEESLEFEVRFVPMLGDFIMKSLSEASINMDEIRWIVPHNINFPTWYKVAAYLGIDKKKLYLDNIPKYGHCFNSDLIINHLSMIKESKLRPGDYYLCVAAGIGTVLASALFEH